MVLFFVVPRVEKAFYTELQEVGSTLKSSS